MPTNDLEQLRASAHSFLLAADRPQTIQRIGRCLFGARRHELPETQAVVATLLKPDPRFIETHDQRWTVRSHSLLAQPFDQVRFVVVDLETTGSVIGVDEIIEIGIVILQGMKIVERFASLVWTGRTIPPWVRRLTGIDKAALRGAPTLADLAPELHQLLDDAVFVAHDIRFDLPFLRWEFASLDFYELRATGLCTLRLSQSLWPGLRSHSLPELARSFGVNHDPPHRAPADAAATAGILRQILKEASAIGLTTFGDLLCLDEVANDDWSDPPAAEAAKS